MQTSGFFFGFAFHQSIILHSMHNNTSISSLGNTIPRFLSKKKDKDVAKERRWHGGLFLLEPRKTILAFWVSEVFLLGT